MAGRNRENVGCPFCKFSTKYEDQYELLLHVETVHPENCQGSPFAERRISHDMDGEGATGQSSEYIECQCGEFCLLAEFESHLEMHYAEGMSFDETHRSTPGSAAPAPTLHQGRASSPATESVPGESREDLIIAPSKTSKRHVASRRSRSDSRKSQGLVHDFMDVLRHSAVPPPKKSHHSRSHKSPQRLGVSFSLLCSTGC